MNRYLPILAASFLAAPAAHAWTSVPTIVLKSSRPAVMNDGRDYHEIIAEVRDNRGAYVPDGTIVTFQTSVGQFNGAAAVGTRAGTARIRLTSVQKGIANITAAVNGGGFQQMQAAFTDDPAETFQGNNYADVQARDSLLYAPMLRIVEASGLAKDDGQNRLPGASLAYRNLEIFADRIQLDCTSNTLKASGNVRLSRGGKRVECARLYLPLNGGDGFVMIERDRRFGPAILHAADLSVTDLTRPVNPEFFRMEDISAAPQLVQARHIRVFPGEKLQFKRPKFYQEGQHLVSMQFYSLGLYSNQLITDQVLSVGSQGLGVDVPMYYDLSPTSTGVFHLRHGEQYGRSAFATRPGLSLDMVQSYNSNGGSRRYTGELGITGINRNDWGVRWSHSHELPGDTRTSFFLDAPQHRGLFGSANVSKQFGGVYAGVNLSGNRSLTGIQSTGTDADVFVESIPKKVGSTGYMVAVGVNARQSRTETAGLKNNINSQSLQARFFSNPFRLDKFTTINNYFTLGNVWADNGYGGGSVVSSLSATRILRPGAMLQATYDFAKSPYALGFMGSHRLSSSLSMSAGNKWSLYAFGSMMLDAQNSSFVSDLNYQIAPRWRLSLASTLQTFNTAKFKDYTIGIGRSIGGRDFVFSYSTYTHRFFFDLQASRF